MSLYERLTTTDRLAIVATIWAARSLHIVWRARHPKRQPFQRVPMYKA